MADHIQKKAKYEKAEYEMPSLEPDITAYELPSQKEEDRARLTTASINYLNSLRSREICDTGKYRRKVPNIFRDYHLQVNVDPLSFDLAPSIVIAGDIIFAIHESYYLSAFRWGGGFPGCTYEDGLQRILKIKSKMQIQFASYNSNNNSLILVAIEPVLECTRIVSLNIEQIKAGLPPQHTTICRGDGNMIRGWGFDIPNCRGMVYNSQERLFKVFELKKYTLLFTIPKEGDDSCRADLRFGSQGNMELFVTMYHKSLERAEVLLMIYSKHTGQLRKRISIPVNPQYSIEHVELCGTDRILLQQSQLGMQILDISAETSKVIKTITEMVGCPYYLCKRNLFICHTERRGVTGLHVFNFQGEIVVTFQDHQIYCEPNLFLGSHIPTAQDIVISICRDKENIHKQSILTGPYYLTINVSSILTGECLGKITAADPSNCCPGLREWALTNVSCSLAYNETTNEIFTGGYDFGDILIWSNKLDNDTQIEYNGSEFTDESSSTDDNATYSDSSVEEDFDDYNES